MAMAEVAAPASSVCCITLDGGLAFRLTLVRSLSPFSRSGAEPRTVGGGADAVGLGMQSSSSSAASLFFRVKELAPPETHAAIDALLASYERRDIDKRELNVQLISLVGKEVLGSALKALVPDLAKRQPAEPRAFRWRALHELLKEDEPSDALERMLAEQVATRLTALTMRTRLTGFTVLTVLTVPSSLTEQHSRPFSPALPRPPTTAPALPSAPPHH